MGKKKKGIKPSKKQDRASKVEKTLDQIYKHNLEVPQSLVKENEKVISQYYRDVGRMRKREWYRKLKYGKKKK